MAPNLLPAIARLVNVAGVDPGDDVLDVGCGTGNVALTARQAGARVVGVDLSRPMLESARGGTRLANYDDIDWAVGDAEGLPFADDSFDVVLSNFGHVFAPDSRAAGEELLRVARSGSRVAFTAWSPDGVVGDLTTVLADHVDDTDDLWSHLRWGESSFVDDQLGDIADLSFQRRMLRFRYVSPQHFWRDFAEEAGPLSPVLGRIDDPEARANLRDDALTVLQEWFGDNAIRVEYLQVRSIVD